MSAPIPAPDAAADDRLRKAAEKRLKRKASFWNFLIVAVIVVAVVNVVWFMTGGYQRYYWPAWVMLGLGIGLVFSALDAFGPMNRYTDEAAVQREMDRMRGGR